jgi:hypothetical protein
MGGGCSTLEREKRKAYRILVVNSEETRPLGKPRRGWEDNIKMKLKEILRDSVGWENFDQDTEKWWYLVSTVMNLWVPKKSGLAEGLFVSQEGLCSMELDNYAFDSVSSEF